MNVIFEIISLPLTIFAKLSVLDVWQGSEYASLLSLYPF